MTNTYSSRYDYGVKTITHKGVPVTTSVSTTMDGIIKDMPKSNKFKIGRVPIYHKHRPDLISNLFYETPAFWWFVLQFNNINDPFEGLNCGDYIRVPKI